MEENSFPKVIIKDPLSEETRKERRNLLGVSVLGIIMVWTGLIPTKISALGVEFDKANQNTILLVLAFVIGYFLIAFVFYGWSDFWLYKVEKALSLTTFNNWQREKLHGFIDETRKDIEVSSQLIEKLIEINKNRNALSKEEQEFEVSIKAHKEYLGNDTDRHIKMLETIARNMEADLGVYSRSPENDDKAFQKLFEKQMEFNDRFNNLSKDAEKVISIQNNQKIRQSERDFLISVTNDRAKLLSEIQIFAYPRLIFEFIIPVVIAIYSIIILLKR